MVQNSIIFEIKFHGQGELRRKLTNSDANGGLLLSNDRFSTK